MIAALPMYDLPELRPVTDRLWAAIRDAIRAEGIEAPQTLTRDMEDFEAHWLFPDLLLSQTCGLPFRARLHDRVTLVGTPDYGLSGCKPGYYRSVFVARGEDARATLSDFEGAVLAYNGAGSQSGWAAPVAHLQAAGLRFRLGPQTGGHRASVAAVAGGRADFAAIDAVTWALLAGRDPNHARLRVVGRTEPSPGLPLIAAAGSDADTLFDAVAAGIAALPPDDRQALHLRGIVRISPQSYLALPLPPNPQAFVMGDPA
ncbi:MAG: PhnD/SsuA/transferrin family substrate-binding protein [Paracoccaceae bacterium]